MAYNLLISGIYRGEITHLLTIDPNFQQDIQAPKKNGPKIFSAHLLRKGLWSNLAEAKENQNTKPDLTEAMVFFLLVLPWTLTCPLKIDGWFRCIPYWNGHFLGDILVFRGVP